MACGDVREIEIIDSKLIAKTQEEYIFNMLSTDYAKNEVEKALNWLEIGLNFEIEQKQKPIDVTEEDIKKLKKIFGEYLIINND